MCMISVAKRDVRNEKRKKQRLMKKAGDLTPEDLEAIAVIKRMGTWDPEGGVAFHFEKRSGGARRARRRSARRGRRGS